MMTNERQGRALAVFPAMLGAGASVFFLMVSATESLALTALGKVSSGETLSLEVDDFFPAARVEVEIDGVILREGVVVRGDRIDVAVPSDLRGVRHDLRVFLIKPDGRTEIGAWLFETDSTQRLFFGSVQADSGFRFADGVTRGFATGAVRLEFDRGEGQDRGRLVISRSEDAGEDGRDPFEINDIFYERRRPLFGQDFFLRLGNSDVVSQSILIDDVSRRGITARLSRPDGSSDVSAFVLGTAEEYDLDNVLGLADGNARVVGAAAILRPAAAPGLRFDLAGYAGRAKDLPDDSTGHTKGYGLVASVPFAGGLGSAFAEYGASHWKGNAGSALAAGAEWQFAEPGGVQSLVLGLEASRIDTDFYSPLNPRLIRGERGVTVSLERIDPMLQWRLSASRMKTNTGGAATDPTDRLTSLSGDLIYDPGDFTGGFLNGTLFFANAVIEDVERLTTPLGAPSAEDSRFSQLSFGMEKLQPNYNWAVSVALDDLNDRTALDEDQRSQFLSGRFAYTPSPELSAQLFFNTGRRITDAARFEETEISASAAQSFASGLWQTELKAGYLYAEDPARDDGRFASFSLSRRLTESTRLFARANWGRDSLAPRDVDGEGWSLELFLRTDFGIEGR